MDETRFDDIAKALGSLTTRRLTFAALLGGVLGGLGLSDAEAKKSGKCKPACTACTTCKKGKCQKKNGKKRCKKGKCKPKANGTLCSVGTCQNGTCSCLGLQQTCISAVECCANTTCGHPVGTQGDRCCQPGGTPCPSGSGTTCCTGICDTATLQCFCKAIGQTCDSNSQCCTNRCVNSLCA